MKKLIVFLTAAALLVSCAPKPRVVWTEGVADPETGRAVQTITLVDAPEGTDWTLWFSSAIMTAVRGPASSMNVVHILSSRMTSTVL